MNDIAAIVLSAMFSISVLPNASLTPGSVRDLTHSRICNTKWQLRAAPIIDERYVPVSMKKRVAKTYNLDWNDRSLVEFDHLIPRCLGGADTDANLWPQKLEGPWGAYVKDKLERKVCKMVCNGDLDLKETQQLMATNWVSLYRRVYGG